MEYNQFDRIHKLQQRYIYAPNSATVMDKHKILSLIRYRMKFPGARFCLAAMAAVMLINGVFIFTGHTTQHKQAQRARVVAESIEKHLSNAQVILDGLALVDDERQPGELEQVVAVTLQSTPYFSELALLPPAQAAFEQQLRPLEPKTLPPFIQNSPGPGVVFTTPFLILDPLSNQVSIYLARPVENGLILGKLKTEPLQAALNAGIPSQGSAATYLTNAQGLIIAHSGREFAPAVALPARHAGRSEKNYNAASFIIENAQVSSQAIVPLHDTGWYVVSRVPLNGLYLPYMLSSFLALIAVATVWITTETRLRSPLISKTPPYEKRLRAARAEPPGMEEGHQHQVLVEALRDTASALTSSLHFDEVMNRILNNVGKAVPHHSSNIMLIEKDKDTVRIVAARGYIPLELQGYPERLRLSIQNTYTLNRMYNSGSPLVIPDTSQNAHWFNLPETSWIRSYAAAPIKVRDHIIGFLNLNSPTAGFYDHAQGNRLLTFADQAGIAIENARLLQELQQSNQELVNTYDITLQGWSKALELRDYETEGHSRRVVELTLETARRMGIEEPELTHMRYGVLLHDIGKIGIPDSILFKPGPLSEDEWRIMRCHPQYALDILASIPYLAPSIDIPYCHHERWDGNGYPRRLKGEEIPLSARIFAIVDVWDGLRQSRPYHTSWSRDEAIRYIKSQSGKQFDPHIVEVFLQLLSEI